MAIYILRRFIQGLVVLFLAAFFIYSILIISPGGPQDQIAQLRSGDPNLELSPEYVTYLEKIYDLDKPWPLNFLAWLFDPTDIERYDNTLNKVVPKGIDVSIGSLRLQGSGVLTGDLGDSLNIQPGVPALELMGGRLGPTLALTITSQLISILIAFPIGIISGIRQYSRLDYTVTTFSFFGLAMPSFWLALMLIIFTAVLPKTWHDQFGWDWLPYLPPGNAWDVGQENNIINRIYHLILPVTVLSFIQVAGLSRFVRSSMLEVLRQDYVRTAWAKGLSQRVVILKHALRNALIPLITILALGLPGLVSGAIITEAVFAYAGMGQLFIRAITAFDIPLAMGFLIISTVLIVLSNILADVLYAVADPRIHYS